MLQLIAESPLITALMLSVLAAGLLFGWLQTGKKQLAILGLVIALLVPVSWFVSENWVTDREQIEMLIRQTADAVEANDHEKALAVIGDEATRRQAALELPQWIFSQADVGSIRSIRVIEETSPKQADVDMIVKVEVSSRSGGMQDIRVPRRLLLTFEKRDNNPEAVGGGWVVTSYQHLPIVGGPDGFSNPATQQFAPNGSNR
ncbi:MULTISPECIES: hypothetical protein [Pirellulaceae]|uniref:1,2-phenylacetyl-CoA epoxidase PaaB subunit n=1 Tax=Aporhodopirellula rubra TaxID=980271 RepID=A0A7W5H926_9BACT|nr:MULTISPECIES: hypothetical protein [Pirellulaceae]EMI46308.1 putative membrane protein [Rhodopirellula sp. SWK7]MBB3209661.1 1,2-phenylacetyl-CoA epoxidase PaaB subunit [Aporhodopirellula rubra]